MDDIKLKISIESFFEKLSKYFPEHKVFALDSIDKTLREKLSELYKMAGYQNDGDFLAAYGFELIAGEEVKKIRSSVLYTPGNEPDIIKNKVDDMLALLEEYYPNRIIPRGIQSDHKSLSKKISGLYQWLGYENIEKMLSAYGYDYSHVQTGRVAVNDYQAIIDSLILKYKYGPKPERLADLLVENPELKGPLKTLQNNANELFGMSFGAYFVEIGILAPKTSVSIKKTTTYHYIVVSVEGTGENIITLTNTRTIKEGEYAEISKQNGDEKCIGLVTETHFYTEEENLPVPIEEMYQFVRKVGTRELKNIEDSKKKYIFCSVKIDGRSDSLYYLSPFEDISTGDIVEVQHNWYGTVRGVVTRIDYVSKKTAPYPVNRTKKIDRVITYHEGNPDRIDSDANTVTNQRETENCDICIEKVEKNYGNDEKNGYIVCRVELGIDSKVFYCPFESVALGDFAGVLHKGKRMMGEVSNIRYVSEKVANNQLNKTGKVESLFKKKRSNENPEDAENQYVLCEIKTILGPIYLISSDDKVKVGDCTEYCVHNWMMGEVQAVGEISEITRIYEKEITSLDMDLPMIDVLFRAESDEVNPDDFKYRYLLCGIKWDEYSEYSEKHLLTDMTVTVGSKVKSLNKETVGNVVEVKKVYSNVEAHHFSDIEISVRVLKKIDLSQRSVIDSSRAMEVISPGLNADDLSKINGTENFVKVSVDAQVTDLYKKTTYFSSAVFRGLKEDVQQALRELYPMKPDRLKYSFEVGYGIYQFECGSSDVTYIIEHYPDLKAIFFAEHWKDGNVYVAYSESGYPTVTSMRLVGKCDFYSKDRWSETHDPSEEFVIENTPYSFVEKPQWEDCNYVLPGGNKKLIGENIIPSIPYRKIKSDAPCEVIEIRYPENESFYVPPSNDKKQG